MTSNIFCCSSGDTKDVNKSNPQFDHYQIKTGKTYHKKSNLCL